MTNSRKPTFRTLLAACALAVGIIAGCGGDNGGNNGNGGTDNRGEPLSLSETQIGAGLAHGMVGHLRDGTSTDQSNLEAIGEQFDHVFLHLQPWDEQSLLVGEWESFEPGANTTNYKRVGHFRNNPAEARMVNRAGDLVDEFQTSFQAGAIQNMSMVIDFWRVRGDWYVRWDDNLDVEENYKGIGPYGFYHKPMVDSLLSQLETIAEEYQPTYMVIGSEMERLLATDDGEGISPNEWSNFQRFYQLAAQRVVEASGQSTRVAVGINWDRFALQVTPRYIGDGEPGEVPTRAELNEAIDTFLAPLWNESFAIALKSYRLRGSVEDNSYYAPLANLDKNHPSAEGKPVIWYSVGAPSPTGNETVQRNYLEAFLEWNRGVDPAVVSWKFLKDYHGSRDPIDGRCKTHVESTKFPMPKRRCFDGLYDESTSPKAPMQFIKSQIGESSE